MTLTAKEREILIENYLQKGIETIDKVEFLLQNNELSLAINRIYYGIFYTISALAIKHKFSTSKHNQLIGWFDRNIVKEKLVDKKISKIIHKAFKDRKAGDYNVLSEFSKEEVEQSFVDMKIAINEVKKLIDKPNEGYKIIGGKQCPQKIKIQP